MRYVVRHSNNSNYKFKSNLDFYFGKMGSLFSKKKEPERPKITEQDKAILVRFFSVTATRPG